MKTVSFSPGVLFGVLCTTMAVAASLMGGVVQVTTQLNIWYDLEFVSSSLNKEVSTSIARKCDRWF